MMKYIFSLLLFVFYPFLNFAEMSQLLMKSKMIEDLDLIKNSFEIQYAPMEWKQVFSGWDLNEKIKLAKLKVLMKDPISIKEYQKIVKSFFISLEDHHAQVFFYSTEASLFPLGIKGAQGRYFISWVAKEINTKLNIPIKPNDEIILYDNIPIHKAIQEFREEAFGMDTLTNQRLAENHFTFRLGLYGHSIPKGKVDITVIHASNGEKVSYAIPWAYNKERISEGPFQSRQLLSVNDPLSSNESEQMMEMPLYSFSKEILASLINEEDDDIPFISIGKRKNKFPPLGEILWESSENQEFYAYLFKGKDGKNYGYLRIPTFKLDTKDVQDFSKIINHFEKVSEALLIDQTNNEGGLAYVTYALLSMFANQPLQVPKQRMTINQKNINVAVDFLNSFEEEKDNDDDDDHWEVPEEQFISGYPLNDTHVKELYDYFNFILNEWNEGKALTQPGYLNGIATLTQHPWGIYTKPVLVLINELDFSAADFFPAILQDNQRAYLFGTKTAGAGGYVIRDSHPNRFGIKKYTLTGSIAERLDKNPIENLGVSPDIFYEITPQDLQNNYENYVTAILNALEYVINSK